MINLILYLHINICIGHYVMIKIVRMGEPFSSGYVQRPRLLIFDI